MWRFVLVLGLILVGAAPAAAQTTTSGARVTQVDSSHYPDITLSVSVADPAGKLVQNLSARDFTVTEDGTQVEIKNFAGGGAPITAALVVDRSGSMKEAGKLEGAQDAAQAFVYQLRPSDQAALLAFSDRPELIEGFTSDRRELARSIGRLRAKGSTALYDSIIAGVDALDGIQGRRALVVLTDGRDRISIEDSSTASTHSLDEAIQTAREAGISAQVIGLGNRATDDLLDGIDEAVLRQIADETGGQYFYAPNASKLVELYASLAATMQQEYQITYRSPRPFYDGTRRDIRVDVAGAATGGNYVEPHMIHVRSNPWLALALLTPVIGLLLLPRFIRSRKSGSAATQPVIPEVVETTVLTPSFCDQCGSRLRSGARFCAVCGAQIIAPPSSEVQQ